MRKVYLLPFVALLAACSNKKDQIPLKGERESILLSFETIRVDSSLRGRDVIVSAPLENSAWAHPSGTASHAMPPVLGPDEPKLAWKASVGEGAGSQRRLLSGPVAQDGIAYTIDADGTVVATSLENGEMLWKTETIPESGYTQPFGGGVCAEEDAVYVATAHAEVLSLNAKTGAIQWRHHTSGPVRTAPTVKDGRVFVVTVSNTCEAYGAQTGELLWTHAGIIETAGLLGAASPAVAENIVIVPYSSGEIYALRADNGFPLWSESLMVSGRLDPLASLSHIKARPIISHGKVFITAHSGRMAAINLKSGQLMWHADFGGIRSPAFSGGFLFVLTNDNKLVAVQQNDGRVAWVHQLPRYVNEKEAKEKILWAGPILVNDKLLLSSSNGKALFVHVKDGSKAYEFDLEGETTLSPIAVQKSLLFLTDSAKLTAYR